MVTGVGNGDDAPPDPAGESGIPYPKTLKVGNRLTLALSTHAVCPPLELFVRAKEAIDLRRWSPRTTLQLAVIALH